MGKLVLSFRITITKLEGPLFADDNKSTAYEFIERVLVRDRMSTTSGRVITKAEKELK